MKSVSLFAFGAVIACVGTVNAGVVANPPEIGVGEKLHVETDVAFTNVTLHGYSLFGYLPNMPAAVTNAVDPKRIHWNRREPRYSSCHFTDNTGCSVLPKVIDFETAGWPVGDYRLGLSCFVMDNGKDRYPVQNFDVSVRDRTRQAAPAVPFAAPDGVLAIPKITGFCGDPTDAVRVDLPWQTGFGKVGKSDPPATETKFKVFHDGDWLYLAIACSEPVGMDKVAALGRWSHDNVMIIREECLEINFDPTGKGQSFYKFAVRPTGDFTDYFAEDDNRGVGEYTYDSKWESGAKVVTRRAEKGWTAEIAVPLGSLTTLWTAGAPQWKFSIGRTRLVTKPAEWTIWPATAKGFCKPETFACAQLQDLKPNAHAWEFNLNKTETVPADGSLVLKAAATLVNRSDDFRFVTADAYLVDIEGKRSPVVSSMRMGAQAGRIVNVPAAVRAARKGPHVLHVEIRSAEGRLETQLVKDVTVEYEPVKIVFTEPCYRDCIFDSQKLTEISGEVRLEEGVGQALEIVLTGPDTKEMVRVAKSEATNRFRFPFVGKAKGDYFVTAGKVTKRLRNLPPHKGEIWIDRDGIMYRDGVKFLPFGWFSDQFTETYPGITISQMYASHFKKPEDVVACCRRCEKHNRIFILRPQQMLGTDGKFLFDTKGEQGAFTDAQKAEIRAFADAVRDEPGFGIYYLVDEPEGRDLNPEWFRQVREFLLEIDPYHPTMMLNYSIEGTIRYAVAGAEINCPDTYARYFTDGTTASPRRIVYDKAKAAASVSQSAWIAPQLFDWPIRDAVRTACGPDFDDIRQQAMMGLAGDARGFLWYTRWSYGGAFTEHMRHGPRILLEELTESRDVFLSPTRAKELKATSTGPDKSLITALKRFGDETLVIAVNTSDREVQATFAAKSLPSAVYPNGANRPIRVTGGRFSDTLAKNETKVYYDRVKKYDHAAQRAYVYGLEAGRRRKGNLAAAPRILTYGETEKMAKAYPEDWYPRFVASSSQQMGYPLPFTYFLQDGIRDDFPIVPYLTWNPLPTDKKPSVRCEFGAKKRFSKVVLYRCKDADGRIALVSGRLVADGRELAAFNSTDGCTVELKFPETESESVTLEVGTVDKESRTRLLSEFEVY